ncbi:MAG: C1 family peptidase [Sarcina sp.]
MKKEITLSNLERFEKDFNELQNSKVIMRAVSTNGINNACEDINVIGEKLNRSFSLELKTGSVSNQQKSGRCWLFAALNTLRHDFAQKYNIKEFEFSQNYLSFYDRLEKANAYYNNIVDTAEMPSDDRLVGWLLKDGDQDGGQWTNAVALIEKYGVVPSYAMPETIVSNNTSEFSQILGTKLRKDGIRLRKMVNEKVVQSEIDRTIEQMLSEVYRMCVYSFGKPPVSFDFEYTDKDEKFHRELNLTPVEFYNKYVGRNLNDYIILINSPEKEMDKLYCLPVEDNVIGGSEIRYLNVELKQFKELTLAQLKDGEVTWFGADVRQRFSRDKGILAPEVFNYDDLFGIDFTMSKADRLEYKEAVTAHAMTFTGVNLVDEKPNRWKVENTWSDKVGDKGYFVMSDKWFDDYVYHVVLNKKHLNNEQRKILDEKPVVLYPWDSMA